MEPPPPVQAAARDFPGFGRTRDATGALRAGVSKDFGQLRSVAELTFLLLSFHVHFFGHFNLFGMRLLQPLGQKKQSQRCRINPGRGRPRFQLCAVVYVHLQSDICALALLPGQFVARLHGSIRLIGFRS